MERPGIVVQPMIILVPKGEIRAISCSLVFDALYDSPRVVAVVCHGAEFRNAGMSAREGSFWACL